VCRAAKSDNDREYRETHKEELKIKRAIFRLKHPAIVKEWKDRDYRKHKQAYIKRATDRKKTVAGKLEHKACRLKSRYSLSLEDRNKMYKDQGGRCKICYVEIAGRNCHVDHDHITGKIRGLLCQRCNMGLGCFQDDNKRLLNAVDYLNN
jgi:hypothetical protein